MKYIPNGQRLIINRKKHELKSKFGIIIPDAKQEVKLSEGYIERVGVGCGEHWDEGMHVIFAQFAGQDIIVDEETYIVLGEDDVLVYGWDTEEE